MSRLALSPTLARSSARWIAIFCVLLVVTVSGCNKTPQEAVLGRWYNSEMSLRFRANGTVIWNTRQGMAQGRYVFVGSVPRWATEGSAVQVRLDVVRSGEAIHPTLDLQFVGADRLKIIPSGQDKTRVNGRLQAVLRRAQSETETVSGPAIPAPANRANTRVRGVQ